MKMEEIKEGENCKFKVKRTSYFLVYEKEYEWYRFEKVTSRSLEYSFIMYKDLVTLYDVMIQGTGLKPDVELMTPEESKERTKIYTGKNHGNKNK